MAPPAGKMNQPGHGKIGDAGLVAIPNFERRRHGQPD
jgi:hypothetical protein